MPLVPKLYVRSVGCPQYAYPNGEFCQRCGYQRTLVIKTPLILKVPIHIREIKDRKSDLLRRKQATPYGKQKSALEKELSSFLACPMRPFDI